MQLCRPHNDVTISTYERVWSLVMFWGDVCLHSGAAPGILYLSLDSGCGKTQWHLAAPGLCMSVLLTSSLDKASPCECACFLALLPMYWAFARCYHWYITFSTDKTSRIIHDHMTVQLCRHLNDLNISCNWQSILIKNICICVIMVYQLFISTLPELWCLICVIVIHVWLLFLVFSWSQAVRYAHFVWPPM